ncbi:MAG TPA: hypothetical protein VH325_05625 [Bryobacteraceae bacterium]|nr:hypothetical protein [Bryobacteraceae bacterium]
MSAMASPFDVSPELERDLRRVFTPALGAGIVLGIISIIGGIYSPGDFFRSYLMGYLFWLGLSLGSMGIVMLQYLTAGAWGIMTRRALESASRTLPLCALLFIPIAVGIPRLYDWAHSDLVRNEYVLRHRHIYMNPSMFIGRAIIYFVIWGIFMYFLNKWSLEQDEKGGLEKRLAKLSAAGLLIYVFTITFATVDWAESLENNWFSTIWGFLFVAREGLASFAFVIIVMALLSRREPLASRFKPAHLHDLGKLLLVFVMLWAYFEFSQLIVIWSGNLTDEIPWYLHRFATSWGWLGVMLIVLEFIVPFLMLLSRPLKRNVTALCCVVGLIIFMRWVDLMWIVMPTYYQRGFRLTWMNLVVPASIGCLWIAVFVWQLKQRPLLPLQAPNLEKALQHGE